MVGTQFTAIPRRSILLYLLPLCVLWSIAMVFFSQHWAPVVVGVPFAVAFCRLYKYTAVPISFELRQDSLWIENTQTEVPYLSVRAIEYVPTSKTPLSSIILTSDSQCVLIPASADTDLQQLFFFFCERADFEDFNTLPANLQPYYEGKADLYTEDDVVAVTARMVPGRQPERPQAKVLGNSLILSAFIVLPIAFVIPWLLIESLVCLVIGGLARFVAKERTKRLMVIRHVEHSAIVISPEGIAMNQGDITGAIEWSRINDISIRNPAHAIEHTGRVLGMAGQIALKVGGSVILIRDVYCSPLFLLYTNLINAREDYVLPENSSDDGDDSEPTYNSPFRPPKRM